VIRAPAVGTKSAQQPACAIYTVCDSRFFLGVVALLNSIRLVGHDEPIFVVDAGLTPGQRELLAQHVFLIPAPGDEASVLLAPLGPLDHPADVAIVLDADIIVTRRLTELIELAQSGRLVGFVEPPPTHDRFFDVWARLLDLPMLRRNPYVNAGQLVFPDHLGQRLLPLWIAGQAKVGLERTRYGGGRLSEPFYFADQDVLNATVAGHLEPQEITILEHRLAPHSPFPGLRLVDATNLVCRYPDGEQPFFLHHVLAKPWLKATPTTVYSQLLTRLLLERDVALRLDSHSLPLRLRESWMGGLDRRRAHLQAVSYSNARRNLGRFGIRTRLADWRRRRRIAHA
jgi:hypothetical protein